MLSISSFDDISLTSILFSNDFILFKISFCFFIAFLSVICWACNLLSMFLVNQIIPILSNLDICSKDKFPVLYAFFEW